MIDTGKYIYFNKSNRLTKSFLINFLNIVPKSYISQIIIRIHDYYFKNSCLLKKDFKRYYKEEYSTFENYLNKKHNLFKHEIEELNYHSACYSEKHFAEKFKTSELLQHYYDDNVIREKIFEFLQIDNDEFGGFNFNDD